MNATITIPSNIRQNIFDGIRLEGVFWAGQLDDVDFLSRLFDLKSMPSYDSRYRDAAGDIFQHRHNNYDWEDDWVFGDARFNLSHCDDATFLKFLCETLHPVVRPDIEEARKLASHYNEQLRLAGWELAQSERIAGRVVFKAQRLSGHTSRNLERANKIADALDADWMRGEIQRVERAIDTDPALAIGTAKDLVESCCKSILDRRQVEYTSKADLPTLTKLVAAELQLVPDGISEQAKGAETVRLILRNLGSLTHYLAQLRGLYGSGHGRTGKYKGLQSRHARLAVSAAVAFIEFVTETYHDRFDRKP